jgi:hypothetical protein
MNHSARLIARLPADEQAKAIADVQRWAGAETGVQTFGPAPRADDPLQLQRPPL